MHFSYLLDIYLIFPRTIETETLDPADGVFLLNAELFGPKDCSR